MLIRKCAICDKEMRLYPSTIHRKRFCSKRCLAIHMGTLTGEKNGRFGVPCSQSAKDKLSALMLGRRQEKSPAWMGGRIIRAGYVYLLFGTLPEDEQKMFGSMTNKGGHTPYIAEHRLVMARHLGRVLSDKEKIHHINGVKSDNRIENLTPLSMSDHKKEHQAIIRELKQLRVENEHLRNRIFELENPNGKILLLAGD